MLKTAIITLQGVSALYVLIGAMSGTGYLGAAVGFGVDTLFFPLAILGLLRICAATWLTEDFVYQRDSSRNISLTGTATRVYRSTMTNDNDIELDEATRALDPLIATPFKTAGFRSPQNSWRSRFFRIFFLLLLGGVWTIALLSTTPVLGDMYFTATAFLLSLFYLLFITVSMFLYTLYFFRGQTTTTILPCISSMWYRLYTLLLMGLMIALVIIASIETNKSPTGLYTSVEIGVKLGCADSSLWWRMPPGDRWIGFATDKKLGEDWLTRNQTSLLVKNPQETTLQEAFWLYNFTGWCVGDLNDM